MFGSIATMIFIPPFLFGFVYGMNYQLPVVVIAMALFVVNGIAFGYTILSTARNRVDFVCELTETTISCINSVPHMGQTFEIPIDEIVEIHKERFSEGRPSYRLKTKDGKLYWLTTNFGNPARSFVNELQQLRPEIPVIDR
jgi:hypothetical protein